MKFRIIISDIGNQDNSWAEEHEANTSDPKDWAEKMIKAFNYSLRPGEKPRMLLTIHVLDTTNTVDHDWEKQNLVTREERGAIYDEYKCLRCRIISRRYGIGGPFVRQGRFNAKKYTCCDNSMRVQGIMRRTTPTPQTTMSRTK